MQLHTIKPKNKLRKKKRIGRGGKRGTYCGRGLKGQKSRAGRKFKPVVRELVKKYPKLRGYKFKARPAAAALNISDLKSVFADGGKVSPESLFKKGLIRKMKGKLPPVKILGRGKPEKKLVVEGCLVSAAAREKIEKAGGKINSQ